jgi:hypothetical protein
MNSTPKPLMSLGLVKHVFPDQSKLADLTRIAVDRDAIRHADIEDSLRSINRRFERLPLKGRTLDLYTNNRIVLLGNKETVVAPTVLPAWCLVTGGRVVAYVNATPYVPAAGPASMDLRRLFGLLVTGEVLVDTYDSWPKLTSSQTLCAKVAAVYARMMHKVADRITGVGMDRMRSSQLKYVFAKYLLVGMAGRIPNEGTDATAAAVAPDTSTAALLEFESSVAAAAKAPDQAALYSADAVNFLAAVASSVPWMSRMTVRGFIQTFTAMYGNPSLLMMESLGYLVAGMASHQIGAELVNSYAFEPVFAREGGEAIDELARLLR